MIKKAAAVGAVAVGAAVTLSAPAQAAVHPLHPHVLKVGYNQQHAVWQTGWSGDWRSGSEWLHVNGHRFQLEMSRTRNVHAESHAPYWQVVDRPECPTEDSTGCVWNAPFHGNGLGRTFFARHNGQVFYLVPPRYVS